mmetsp:Transcript_24992/g.57579  ORF Transcript_24992/g.57579 Transcript_24992/m.57579 type:complete len:225 (+) Transcript_24992:177-851(+)
MALSAEFSGHRGGGVSGHCTFPSFSTRLIPGAHSGSLTRVAVNISSTPSRESCSSTLTFSAASCCIRIMQRPARSTVSTERQMTAIQRARPCLEAFLVFFFFLDSSALSSSSLAIVPLFGAGSDSLSAAGSFSAGSFSGGSPSPFSPSSVAVSSFSGEDSTAAGASSSDAAGSATSSPSTGAVSSPGSGSPLSNVPSSREVGVDGSPSSPPRLASERASVLCPD